MYFLITYENGESRFGDFANSEEARKYAENQSFGLEYEIECFLPEKNMFRKIENEKKGERNGTKTESNDIHMACKK